MTKKLNIEDVPLGTTFRNRNEIKEAGLHRRNQHGISKNPVTGLAETIVLNGGYVDDKDFGQTIRYTGQGGNENGEQTRDQEFKAENKALFASRHKHEKVRVIRGYKLESKFAPKSGYRYDGFYYVTNAWKDRPEPHRHLIYQFELTGVPGEFGYPGMAINLEEEGSDTGGETGNPTTTREDYIGSRIIRDTKISKEIKELYNGTCQACSLTLPLPSGVNYAEGAHIHPLGKPHDGPDSKANILCLCPNCHVRLDYGAFYIDDELNVQPDNRPLNVHEEHQIDKKTTRFHKKHIYLKK